MERPLKEVKLPKSGYIAKIITFLTRGEDKHIYAKKLEGGRMEYVDDDVQIKNLSVNFRQRQEDALIEVGVKELHDEKGNKMELGQKVFDDLPKSDFNILLLELNKVYAGVATPSKKKS